MFANFRALVNRVPAGHHRRDQEGVAEQGRACRHNFDPASIARVYAAGGAAALSVLTDREFFQGMLDDLQSRAGAVELPVLRKDFTIDEFHVIEAAAHGADAILLIAALLDESQLRRFRELAAHFGWRRWWRCMMKRSSIARSRPALKSSA